MKGRFQIVLVVSFLMASVTALYALDVVLESLQGDVDVKRGAGSWEAGQTGMKLSPGDRVATGFSSEAKLRFEDNSLVTVRPLTQMTIDRFLKDAVVRTDIAVKIGEINAEVNRTKEIKSDFVVITPTSVVSVRGTNEDVNVSDKGAVVDLNAGSVRAQNEQGQPTQVAAGQEARLPESAVPTTPIDTAIEQGRTDTTTGFGLTNAELSNAQFLSDPSLNPGAVSQGQQAPTDEAPPVPQEAKTAS